MGWMIVGVGRQYGKWATHWVTHVTKDGSPMLPRHYRRAVDYLTQAATTLVNEQPLRVRVSVACHLYLAHAVESKPDLVPTGQLRDRMHALWARAALVVSDDPYVATAHLSDLDLNAIAHELLALAFQAQKLYCGCETETATDLET